MNKLSPFSFYLLFYAALAAMMPFLVLYYQQLGLSGVQIGLLIGGSQLVSLAGGPFWTGIADATRKHKRVMSLALVVLVASGILFPFLKTLVPLAILAVLNAFFTAPVIPLSDSAILSMLGSEKEKYGRISLGGTLGWGLAAPLVGILVQTYGLSLAFWSYACLVFLALLVCQSYVFAGVVENHAARASYRSLLASNRWVLFLLIAFISGLGFATLNNYLFAYLKELHAAESTMGLALTIATLSEFPVLYFANHLLRRLGSQRLMRLAMAVTAGRLLLFGVLGSLAGVLFLQVLNGLSMPLFWVAGVNYAAENAPAGLKASAQSLLGLMVSGLGAAAGGLLGGYLLGAVGGQGTFAVTGVLMLASLVLVAVLERKVRPVQVRLLERS